MRIRTRLVFDGRLGIPTLSDAAASGAGMSVTGMYNRPSAAVGRDASRSEATLYDR